MYEAGAYLRVSQIFKSSVYKPVNRYSGSGIEFSCGEAAVI